MSEERKICAIPKIRLSRSKIKVKSHQHLTTCMVHSNTYSYPVISISNQCRHTDTHAETHGHYQSNTSFVHSSRYASSLPNIHIHIQIYIFLSSMSIGLARGCSGCRGTPRAKKNIWGVIYRGKLQVHYPGTARSQIF